MTVSDQLQELVAQPIVGRFNDDKYMSAVREMNIHDFHEPEEGGVKLISNMDSAMQELSIFMRDRQLELLEPMQVRITVEVSARAQVAEKPEPDAKV